MCGSQRSAISPSISTTRRSTPWAAGCCGPKFIVRVLISTSDMSALCRLLVARQHVLCALPRTQKVEAAELLGELHWLVDDAPLHVVPAQLDEARQRGIPAHRMAPPTA